MEETIKLEVSKYDVSLLREVMERSMKTVREALVSIERMEAETLQLGAQTREILDQLKVKYNVENNL